MLPPLQLARGPERGGVWDVLTLDHGDLVYTALSDHVGWINPESGAALFATPPEAGVNELAELEDGRVAVTQYFEGSVLIYDKSGTLERRLALRASPGTRVAPKSIAFDPTRGAKGWIWVTTDLFPSIPQGGVGARAGGPRHDGRAIDLETGAERVRVESPELQNLVFDRAGTGFFVWSGPEGLVLQTLRADENPDPRSGQRIGLFPSFDASHDFAQDVAVEASNRVVVTLWSGRVFVVEADGVVRSLQLPRDPPGSLFYSAALRGDRICATRCAGVAVVCADLP